MHGMSAHLGRDSQGIIQLERTGPFMPPISFPGIGDIVVTDAFRRGLETSGLTGFSLREVRLTRIVRLHWHVWDLDAEEPQEYPSDGEPESYILEQEHCPELAEQMQPVWEMALEVGAREVRVPTGKRAWESRILIESGSLKGLDFFRADTTAYNYVSQRAKDWLAERAADHVSFQECEFRPKP